jgi:hypothetical protein
LKSAKAKEGFDLAGLKMMERPIWAKSLRRLNFLCCARERFLQLNALLRQKPGLTRTAVTQAHFME